MLLVSVIIPNYNYGKFLPLAVKSLVLQTYKDLELIIIDDGSTDNSQKIIESLKATYKERFNKFWSISLKENRGKLHALNKVVPLVHGDITVILDADDYLEINYVEETVCTLIESNAKDKRIAFLYTDSWLVDTNYNTIGRGESKHFCKDFLQNNSYIPGCAPIFTSVLKEALPFNESIRVGTKHHKWQKIVNCGWKGHYLQKPLFYYRMHDQNLSGIGLRILQQKNCSIDSTHNLSNYWQTSD